MIKKETVFRDPEWIEENYYCDICLEKYKWYDSQIEVITRHAEYPGEDNSGLKFHICDICFQERLIGLIQKCLGIPLYDGYNGVNTDFEEKLLTDKRERRRLKVEEEKRKQQELKKKFNRPLE